MILREIHENKRKQNLSLFQNPVLTISNLWDSSKQCSSKFFEHSRGSLGKDVLPTAWIHARRIATSSGNLWKRILGSFFLFLAWILHSKATQCGILLQIYREHGNRATILRQHTREPCAPIKMAMAGSSNTSWRPLFRSKKEKSRAREHFCVQKIYFWKLKEHFGRYFLKEWGFPLSSTACKS